MEAAHRDSYTLGLPLITMERAYEVASRGIYQPFDTLVAGQVYDLVNACHRFHDIFVVMKHNFLTLYKVILLPRRCHENFKKFLNIIDLYYVEKVYFTYTGHMSDGKRVFLVDGGGFCQTLI